VVTRIVAGLAGGRRLAVPPGHSVRPTSDRVREALFASVLATLGSLSGASVLDLYAGSGAVGLEALSRGAADVLLIEADARAAEMIRRNIAAVGLPGARLICDRVERVLSRGASRGTAPGGRTPRATRQGPYELVFADPPYSAMDAEIEAILRILSGGDWLAAGALVVLERDTRSGPVPWPPGYAQDRSRRYGETTLWYGRASGDSAAATAQTTGA
jgi:16S rRNA (guanine966-N2)-methyltransferase